MRSHERLYSYRQSQQIKDNTGCIGYLRVDMDRDGKGFWTAWENECLDRKTTAFKDEFNEVIETLRNDERFGGILKTRLAMYNYCYDHPEAQFDDGRVYGFRVDSEKYAYLLRLTPYPHEYNAYCFCYEREPLDRHLKGAEKGISILGPDYKEKFHIPDGDMIRINREDGSHSDLPCRYVDDSHIEVGYGWDSQFHVCEFADQMDRCNYEVIPLRSTLPDKCYCVMPSSTEVIAVKKGERGYHHTDRFGKDKEQAQSIVAELNRHIGVDKAQAAAMLAGSMFGWDRAAADPVNYDLDGKPLIRPQREAEETRPSLLAKIRENRPEPTFHPPEIDMNTDRGER